MGWWGPCIRCCRRGGGVSTGSWVCCSALPPVPAPPYLCRWAISCPQGDASPCHPLLQNCTPRAWWEKLISKPADILHDFREGLVFFFFPRDVSCGLFFFLPALMLSFFLPAPHYKSLKIWNTEATYSFFLSWCIWSHWLCLYCVFCFLQYTKPREARIFDENQQRIFAQSLQQQSCLLSVSWLFEVY